MNKKIYDSNYTDNKVTAAQYLTEFICIRIAAKENKNLSYKFWNSKEWSKIFLRQLKEANELLKEVDIVNIMAFLRSPKGRKIYSLGLHKQIIEGSKTLVKQEVVTKVVEEVDKYGEEYILYPEEVIEDNKEIKKNLWSKLG